MILFTIAPLMALIAAAALAVRRGPSGPMADAQLPFMGAGFLNGDPGTVAVVGLALLPAAFESFTQYMVPQKGVLRSLLVKNVVPGSDAVDLTYMVRVNGQDVGIMSVRNDDATPVKINISQVSVKEGDLISLLIANPGFPGTAPSAKCVLMWRPL